MIYQTNWDFDYRNTHLKLFTSPLATVEQTEKGLLWVHFKGCKSIALISPRGKIVANFSSDKDKERVLGMLRKHLVSKEHGPVEFKPVGTTVTLK